MKKNKNWNFICENHQKVVTVSYLDFFKFKIIKLNFHQWMMMPLKLPEDTYNSACRHSTPLCFKVSYVMLLPQAADASWKVSLIKLANKLYQARFFKNQGFKTFSVNPFFPYRNEKDVIFRQFVEQECIFFSLKSKKGFKYVFLSVMLWLESLLLVLYGPPYTIFRHSMLCIVEKNGFITRGWRGCEIKKRRKACHENPSFSF